jgi:hypothetical protein
LPFDEVEDVGRIAPPLPNLDLKVQEHLALQDVLDLAAGFDPDGLDELAMAPDDDLALVVLLDEDVRFDVGL